MASTPLRPASTFSVILAFATVYIVWGSTYFFIRLAIESFPPFLMGTLRFLLSGSILLGWCLARGERLLNWSEIKPALVTGLLLLFVGNGGVIWAEQYLASSLVAVLVSAAPIWFVLLDKTNWKENFNSRETIIGLLVGFLGVVILFGEQVIHASATTGDPIHLVAIGVLIIGSVAWSAGSLYSKYHASAKSGTQSSAWQMLFAGLAFIPGSLMTDEWAGFHWEAVTLRSWMAIFYLVFMGSLAAYSAYVWLLQVRPTTQVSTYAYVNPVVAVLLGVFLAGETISVLQLVGLGTILGGVLLMNLEKFRKERRHRHVPVSKVV